MGTVPMAALALDGGDPRFNHPNGPGVLGDEQLPSRKAIKSMHDDSVQLEEYLHYAELARADEVHLHGAHKYLPLTPGFLKRGHSRAFETTIIGRTMPTFIDQNGSGSNPEFNEKALEGGDEKKSSSPIDSNPAGDDYWGVTLNEWQTASRARRTATWGAVFYLITTDILGPFSVPWALSQMGYGPGVALYFVFGLLAFYAGLQMYQMFMRLDSIKYPLAGYGDMAYRIYGKWARHFINSIQSIQLFFNVGILILSNGQGIFQLSVGPASNAGLCFIVCSLVFAIAGFLLGQVRSLARFGWIANLAIWLNIVLLCLTMGVVAHSAPNYDGALKQSSRPLDVGVPGNRPAIHHESGVPDAVPFQGQVVGLMQAVYSYGGAMLYCEFMSEMKKPWDFFKAQLCAEAFIFSAYIFFGIFVYSFQGQYTMPVAFQGMEPYALQSAGNALALISGLIAAALYGNIGIKVVYNNVLAELFGFPPLETKTGKIIWVGLVPVYWSVAFLVCSAIPNITSFSGFIAAVCIMQFSYTFPPFMMLGFDIQRHAMLPEETFDPSTGQVHRVDAGMKRWARGFKKQMPLKLWYILFMTGSLATAILGTYSSIIGLISAFESNPNIVAFSCTAPI